MKTYIGTRSPRGDTQVTVRETDGSEHALDHIVRHSPDGFEWGYGGSGPAELARCILIDYLGGHDACWDPVQGECVLPVSYQDYKFQVIAALPRDLGWEITEFQVAEWVRERVAGRA